MVLKDLHIPPTDKSPEVILDPKGILRIQGRGLALNSTDVTDRTLKWIEHYLENPADVTYVYFAFEYLNSFSTSVIVSALKKLSAVMLKSKKLKIIWLYEEDDDDIMERGEYIAAALHMPIEFIATGKDQDH